MTLPIRIANNIDFDKSWTQGRRLVINIEGGKNFGHKYWGGKNFWEIYFQTKNLEKVLFYSSKNFSQPFFLVIDNFFTKLTHLIQNVLRFLCIVVSISAFFHVYFF